MPKIIVLEGVDSTGKSSLAKLFAKELNACYFHASGHKTMHFAMTAHHMSMLHDIEVNLEQGRDVVCDRHWMSEIAYASVLRPEQFAWYKKSEIFNRISKLSPRYVHCCGDIHTCFERYERTHADHDRSLFHHLTFDQYKDIAMNYLHLFMDIPHHVYSIEENGMRQLELLEKVIA